MRYSDSNLHVKLITAMKLNELRYGMHRGACVAVHYNTGLTRLQWSGEEASDTKATVVHKLLFVVTVRSIASYLEGMVRFY